MTPYTQGNVGFVLVFAFFLRCAINTIMSWGLSMPYQKQPNLSWVPDLGRNLFFDTLGDGCNMLTSLPVLRDV